MKAFRHQATPGILALAVIGALGTAHVDAETVIYKSTDARGQVTYGDEPAPNSVGIQEIRLPGYPAGSPKDISSEREELAATTDRLRADRIQREKARAAADPPPAITAPVAPVYPSYRAYPGPWAFPGPLLRHGYPYPRGRHQWQPGRPSVQPHRPPARGQHPEPPSLLHNPGR